MLFHPAVLVVFEVLSVAASPSSSHPHEPTDIANTFPRAPFFLTLPLINTSQAGEHFAYFKNSPLSDPISCSATASGRNGSKITSHAQVKSQTKFCSHLVPRSQYALLPTSVTPAAFFPTWSSILISIFVGIVKYISSVSLVNEGSLKKVGVANFVHDIGLVVAWWCGTIISLRNPHHAVWQNVMTWILVMPYSFLFFPLVIFPLAQMAAIGYSVYVRFSATHKVGAIAYTLMPSFSVESLSPTAECLALITNPLSDLYVDALYDQNRALQALEFSLSLLALIPFVFMFIPGCANGENDAKIMFLTIAWLAMLAELLIPLIWLGILAGRGTPITWSHECGVVVIGMSPRLGYWDVKVPDTLQTVQVVRAIFGL